jgi:hypothetical protein
VETLHSDLRRGSSLLLAHCAVVDADDRESAYERLEHELGDLAHLLVFALSGDHGRCGSSSP